jgi:zinc protease
MRIPFLALLVTLLFGQTAQAEPSPAVLDAKRFTLDNGLTVLLLEDHAAPFVQVLLSLDVGSAHDPAHSPGTSAVMVELLENASTRHVRDSDRFGLIEAFGVHPWTTEVSANDDRTWIRALVPSHALELALFLESDRLGYFSDGIDAASVRHAQKTLTERLGTSWTDSFRSVAYAAQTEMFGPKHAYGVRWGAREITRFKPSELRLRARRLYGPNRAVLALTGDVTLRRAKELAQRYFGTLPRVEAAPKLPQQASPTPLAFELTSKTKEEGVYYAWRTPAYLSEPDYALDGISRVLRRRLIDRLITPGIAGSISAVQSSSALASTFSITALPAEGHTVNESIRIIDEELASLRDKPIPAPELQSAKDWLRLNIVDHGADVTGRGGLAISFWALIQNPNGYATYLDRYRALGSESIQRAVRDHLPRTPHVIAIRRRGNEEKDIPERKLPPVPKGKGDAAGVPKSEAIRLTPPEVGSPPAFEPPSVDDIALATGARALVHENHDFPRIRMRLIVDLGPKQSYAPVSYAARLLEDARLPGGKTLRQALLDFGTRPTIGSDLNTILIDVAVLPEHFAPVSKLLVDVLTRGKLVAEDFARMKKNYRPLADTNLRSRVHAWADEFVFTDKSGMKIPYAKVDPTWRSVPLADIERMLAKLTGAQLTFVVHGDAAPADTKRVLEAATLVFAKKKGKRERPAPVQLNPGMFLVDDPQAKSVSFEVMAQIPTRSEPDGTPATALRWFFSTNRSISVNLGDRFREAGITRYRDQYANALHQPRFSAFVFEIDTAPEEAPKTITAVLQQMQRLRDGRIPAAAVAQSRRESQTSLRENLVNTSETIAWMTTIAVHGDDKNLMTATHRRSQMYGHDELVRAAKAYLVPEKLAVIVLGNLTPIRAELEKLGLPVSYRKVP